MPDTTERRFEPQLAMLRPDLDNLPQVSLPNGYVLRRYRTGDAEAWAQIIGESFEIANAGERFAAMLTDDAFAPERVLFVCRGEKPVATASAWHRPEFGERVGYLHMVGVLPSESGKGLGLQVSLACLHVMRSEGRTSCLLHTDDFRLAALKTYLKLDFRPLLVHENQRDRWRAVFAAIGRPELAERFRDVLEGKVHKPSPPDAL